MLQDWVTKLSSEQCTSPFPLIPIKLGNHSLFFSPFRVFLRHFISPCISHFHGRRKEKHGRSANHFRKKTSATAVRIGEYSTVKPLCDHLFRTPKFFHPNIYIWALRENDHPPVKWPRPCFTLTVFHCFQSLVSDHLTSCVAGRICGARLPVAVRPNEPAKTAHGRQRKSSFGMVYMVSMFAVCNTPLRVYEETSVTTWNSGNYTNTKLRNCMK